MMHGHDSEPSSVGEAYHKCAPLFGNIPVAAMRTGLRYAPVAINTAGAAVRRQLTALGVEQMLTAHPSPWQNPYAERWIGSISRECLNHIVLSARHLKKSLAAYFRYDHESRVHLALGKQCPIEREIVIRGRIVAIEQVGGLHHRYERQAV
jgi:hypothetical protein